MTATGKTSRRRLVLLTQWFDPEPVVKGLAFAKRLGELGFDVEVVTGFPNYPGGKVYDGYRIRPIRRETVEGVAITRLALYPSHDRSRIGRVLNYVSFFLAATIYLIFFARRADVIYAYHPPLTVGMAAAFARLVRRIPVVLDVQDIWPDTLRATGMLNNERILRIIGAFCRWTWRNVDRILAQSSGFRKLLIERGVDEKRIRVIYNWADEDAIRPSFESRPEAFRDRSKFRVLFAGNIGLAQALDVVIDAAEITAATHPHIEFCLLGSGLDVERLKSRAAEKGLPNIRFLPRVPMAEVGAWIAAADCVLVHLRNDPLFAITIPSKIQAYMTAGKPIVVAVAGDAADMVRESTSGVAVPPEDPQALADAVRHLAALDPAELGEFGANAREFYEHNMSFDLATRATAELLEDASRRHG